MPISAKASIIFERAYPLKGTETEIKVVPIPDLLDKFERAYPLKGTETSHIQC